MRDRSLNRFATIVMGQSPDSASVSSVGETGLPFLQGCAEFGRYYPSPKQYCSSPLRVAPSGSTLISVRAPVGTTNRADRSYCIGRGLASIKAIHGVSNDLFLQYCLENNPGYLARLSQGSTFAAVASCDLKGFPVPEFETAQQRRIAEILSTVDEAIEQTERLIAKQQQIKAGLMQDLFTRGAWTAASIERARVSGSPAAASAKVGQLRPPRENAPELYKESPLGWIPKDWDIRRLSEIGKVVTGRTPPSNVPGVWGAGLPFVTPADFVHNAEIRIGERSISGKGQTFVNLIPADSVLVVCIGSTIGKVSLVTQECATNQQINALVSFAGKASVFTREAVTRNVYQLRKWMGLQAVPIVKKSQFEKLKIEWPDEGERTAIERYAKAHDDATDENQRTLEKLQKQKQGLMQDLLTGKVPVGSPEVNG